MTCAAGALLPSMPPLSGYRRAVPRSLPAAVVAAILSLFAVLLLTGHYVSEGPVLLEFGDEHGVHLGDVLVVLAWAAAILCEVRMLRTERRSPR